MSSIRILVTAFVVLAAMAAPRLTAADESNLSQETEQAQLTILRSDAPPAEKAIACKKLAIDGSSASVPELAKLLTDPQLASWARIALEAIPGKEADEALRLATESLDGRLLIGTINSIGVRRDAQAVDLLTTRLQGEDEEVAVAAARALGNIGSAEASKSLQAALAGTSARVCVVAAEGCILCAEQFLADGQAETALQLFDQVRSAELPQQRILEATRGAILAREDEGIPLLLEQLRSSDQASFRLALSTARELPGDRIDRALADELAGTPPARAALLVVAMADRGDTVILPAILAAAQESPKEVQLAAIGVLSRVGDASCLAPLLEVASGSDEDLTQAAKETLAEMPGDSLNTQIVALLPEAKGKTYPLLLELVGQRRIAAAPALMQALESSDAVVRAAALGALGETVNPQQLEVLVSQVVTPRHAEDAQVAERALKAASIRMPDREACAAELTEAFQRTPSVATKSTLLQILGAVGGTQALATLGDAAKSQNDALQDASTRVLGEWMTADAAPVLLDLASTAPGEKYQIRALRGYIRIARQFDIPLRQRIEMSEKAMEVAQRTAEQKLILEVLQRYPHPETLRLAVEATQQPQLKKDATQATLVIAQKLGGDSAQVRNLLATAGLERIKLEIVKAEYGAGSTQEDVTLLVRKHAGDLPLITLPSASYNANFGGDPAPGTPKKLRIQYRINGKPGEATFDENALILLPSGG